VSLSRHVIPRVGAALFADIRKRLALSGYRRRLGRHLDRKHHGHRMFTVREVRAGARDLGLSAQYLSYAYALYCTEAEFNAYHARIGLKTSYVSLRNDILKRPKYALRGGNDGHDWCLTTRGRIWDDSAGYVGDSGGDGGGAD
jgi:hypothetical protein